MHKKVKHSDLTGHDAWIFLFYTIAQLLFYAFLFPEFCLHVFYLFVVFKAVWIPVFACQRTPEVGSNEVFVLRYFLPLPLSECNYQKS